MIASDNARIIRAFFDAVNRHDADRALAFVDNNVVWTNVATCETFRGHDGLRQTLQGWWRAFPDNKMEMTNLVTANDGEAVEYIGRGTNTGPFVTRSGQIPATGRRMEMRFCDVYEVKNGKIVAARTYYDNSTLMNQLGQAPTAR